MEFKYELKYGDDYFIALINNSMWFKHVGALFDLEGTILELWMQDKAKHKNIKGDVDVIRSYDNG